MNFKNKNWQKLILFSYIFFTPAFVLYAQGQNPTPGIKNPVNIDSIPGFIQTILEGALKVGIPVIALAIVYCGFLFVKARGKPEEITKAKDALLYTLIGAAILLGSWAIAKMISATVTGLGA
ncbi:MAG: hypothetical protein UU13_C0012G0019 [Candidatus Nomurabacteria bacterium GW2011_GWB1_40_7]|uniref:TrbC/VIRB2 family protein n=1 Tax=Candidatus Nomurabacteria bacterium GW2011_GWB1_40_7 TaxID=1618744 RepID=A0A0G0SZF2_9BACT|nr:MAG: hypothetical protein UU13_C0012G0019 [Candidatus Nomurabacteria bacterium GW2011_GWB1_40_7]